MKIKINEIEYKVKENMGYQNGYYVKMVECPESPTGERIVVRYPRGEWKFYEKPTIEYFEQITTNTVDLF